MNNNFFNTHSPISVLPYDGTVHYYGKMFSEQESQNYLEQLLHTIEWKNDEAVIFGKHIVTKRKAAWYGDQEYSYTYSKITKHALRWTPGLLQLKERVEEESGESYNSCLLNLYQTGAEGMAYHSDDEKTLGHQTAIASLSFGAERKFLFKHKRTKEMVSLLLQSGSLLVMKEATQTNWLHRLPPSKKVFEPRINLTFRTIVQRVRAV